MTTLKKISGLKDLQTPPDLCSKAFADNKYEYYKWMRQEAPVAYCKYVACHAYVISRYEDCTAFLTGECEVFLF